MPANQQVNSQLPDSSSRLIQDKAYHIHNTGHQAIGNGYQKQEISHEKNYLPQGYKAQASTYEGAPASNKSLLHTSITVSTAEGAIDNSLCDSDPVSTQS